ncbi:nonribosomal peptide synthase, putative [Talaromyces stipitatus ATCC 10500]|uniref:Nonribosomal peptide synthase, putative n=1 Tax=Talaromyces stipitatus (strain ATCC 10500 / CBS 375.48 / QM 6759 / NRRL 1006) TaxID=441959 RepID=B8MC36_TALSN|nr:nonribosomal peptide synthase, putative [Talaromyces stipitatus ATCC 10500]EED18482.1 nonribosomal peptide synthase, putative [Talaromyces stipitatus ATCC 10500]
MLSVTVPTPSAGASEKFCTDHAVTPRTIFQLTWALIQNCYFDTSDFLYEEEDTHGNIQTLISFLPELIKKSPVIATLQRDGRQEPGEDTILLHSGVEGVDASLRKVWSRLKVSHSTRPEGSSVRNSHFDKDFDVEIHVNLGPSNLIVSMLYQPSIADTRDMDNIAKAFHQALESILTIEDDEKIADINLLNPNDAMKIFEWNSSTPTVTEDCLHLLIERSVSRNPDSQALLSWDGSLTYSELDQHSSKLAHYLVNTYDLGPEKIVPLCFEKSIWAVVTMLAVLKTGAAYCCLDPAHPQARRDYMTELVNARIALCCEAHSGLIQKCPSLIVDADFVYHLETPSIRPTSLVQPSNACVIAFTSGTTGNPKAIIHSHTSVCSGLLANAPFQRINRSDIRLFQWAAYTFDVSITETFSPLIYGGLVCIPSEEERLNDVEECMTRMNVDWAYFTPSFARFFRRYNTPGLTQLILGGEAVTVDDVRDWVDRVRVLNAYGPAESITWFLEPQLGLSSTISIGKPINMRAWIVSPDDETRLMPIGAIGELLLEGTSLFRAYLKNQEKTDQSLISPPKWRLQANIGPALKMYKTGDLVRYLPDGNMTYVGRKDTMVKLYGQRMELEEVETVLRRCLPEGVQASADIIRPAGENEEVILVAFFCVPKNFGQDLHELKVYAQSKLADALPAFMVPRVYIPVDEMPYNSSRKLDRAKLRQMVSNLTRSQLVGLLQAKDPVPNHDISHGLSEMEADLQRLWASALFLEPNQIGPEDNFFALGGSSVTILKITAAAKSQGIAISYADIFRAPTLRSLSQVVSRASGSDTKIPPLSLIEDTVRESVISDAVVQCDVSRDEIEDIYPLAPQQQGLWALSLIRDGDYVGQFILTLNPHVDIHKFCQAWETVVSVVPTLRTRFIESASGSFQVVIKSSLVDWQSYTDLDEYLQEDIQENLAFGSPLVRYAIIPSTKAENGEIITPDKIVWTIHHALFDGESVPTLLNTVTQAYYGIAPSLEIGLFNRFIQYTQGVDQTSASKFWRQQFSTRKLVPYPPLPEPDYRPRPESVYDRHIQFTRRLGSNITTATLLRAALSLSLVKMAKTWDVAMGVTLTGRTAPVSNIENVIGPTFVTLPTRPIDGSSNSVAEYLERIQTSIIETIPFEHTGMQRIAAYTPECNSACLFQTILLVQTPDDKSYQELFHFDDSVGGYGRFNSHCLMVLLFTNADHVDAAFSYDSNAISDDEVVSLAYIFERFIHTLCLEEEKRVVSSVLSGSSLIDMKSVIRPSIPHPPTRNARQPSKARNHIDAVDMVRRPNREIEVILADAWAEVLGIPDKSTITPGDEFIKTYGGNSLLSLKLAQYCRGRGLRLTVKSIFQYPRFQDMAGAAALVSTTDKPTTSIAPFSLIEGGEHTDETLNAWKDSTIDEAAEACSVARNSILDIYPSTPLQEGLVVLSMAEPGAYISRTVYELAQGVDIERFFRSWAKVYQQEEILRTRIFQPTGIREAFQVVVSEDIEWQHANDLAAFMSKNKTITMGLGTRLCQFTLVSDLKTSKQFFILTIHHALYDGWSIPLLLKKVYDAYHAMPSTTTHIMFNTFIQHTLRNRPSDVSEYWTKQFKDADFVHFPAPLLPGEKPGNQSQIERSFLLRQPETLPGILKSTILRAAWTVLLNCYTRNQDVVFGATLAGRNVAMPGIQDLIGPTLTTVPIRVNVDAKEKLGDFLHRIQDQSVEMIDYEHTGLHTIRSISPEACNFQNLLVLQPKGENTDLSKLWVSEAQGDTSKFFTYPLVVQCSFDDASDDVLVGVTFDESRIHEIEALRIIRLYEHILAQISSIDISTVLDKIDLISPGDILELKNEIAESSTPEVVNCLLHEQVFKRIGEYSEKIAITSSWGEELTYKQLHDFSSRLAHDLVKAGAGPGIFIPLFFDKDIWAIVAMIAVLKSGSAFVPIDPESPSSRRDLILRAIRASVILSSSKYIHITDLKKPRQVDREHVDSLALLNETGEGFEGNSTVADPAYAIFTSGSTGIPKGVVVSHRAISSSVNAHGNAMGFGKGTRALQFCSYTFDVSIAEIFTTLVFGGTVCVPSSWGRLNNLAAEICILEANWSFLTPSVARLLDPSEVPTLRTLVLGGEEVGSGDVARWKDTGDVRIMNGYGPTEACVFCVTRDIDTPDSANKIGRPIGCNAFVVDPENHDKLAPVGTVGEMLVSGPILASGYLSDGSRTRAAFIESPSWSQIVFGEPPSADRRTFYKTGDLVRYDRHGLLEYVSRKDLQVKIRGLRIEVEDVEHWIQTVATVKHAVVLVSRSSGASTQFTAVLSLNTKGAMTDLPPLTINSSEKSRNQIQRVKATLEEHLPSYAIPNIWLCVNDIPLSTSGKTSRKTVKAWIDNLSKQDLLQAYSGHAMNGNSDGPKPVGHVEIALTKIWSSVLTIPEADIVSNKSFLSYGGDSVSAIRVVKECRKQSLDISIQDLLLAKGISHVAEKIQGNSNGHLANGTKHINGNHPNEVNGGTEDINTISGMFSKDTYICTPLQQAMVQKHAEGLYNVKMVFNINCKGTLDIQRLKDAWSQVILRHDALRTTFKFSNETGQRVQRILDTPVQTLHEELESETSTLAVDQSIQPHPVWPEGEIPHRLTVGKAQNGKAVLNLEISHAIIDAVSLATVFRDLELAYDGRLPPQPAPQLSQYLQRIWYQAKQDVTYWRQYCAGASPCYIPWSLSKHTEQPRELLHTPVTIPGASEISLFCRQQGVTVANLIHTVWALVLKLRSSSSHLAGSEVCFGYLVSGRDLEIDGVDNIVGPLISMLLCRKELSDSMLLRDLLTDIRDDAIQSSSRKFCEIKQIEKDLGLGRGLFNTMINFRKYPRPVPQEDIPLRFEYIDGQDPFEYDVSLVIDEVDNNWQVKLVSWKDRVSEFQINGIAASFSRVLKYLMVNPEQTISNALNGS